MNNKLATGLAISISLTLASCGGTPGDNLAALHVDTPTAVITDSNALVIAAEVYQVAAVDVPFTAAIAMTSGNAINSSACTDMTALSGANSGNMAGMGMDMTFNNCTLSASPSSHTLTVNGQCSNSDGASTGIEVVTGREISFTTQAAGQSRKTLGLHNFVITRNNDNMTNATGSLHLADGKAVLFLTPTDFSGSAMAPTAGSLLVRGAGGSRLRLTIDNGGSNFTLEVDANGDGSYETSSQGIWATDFWLMIP